MPYTDPIKARACARESARRRRAANPEKSRAACRAWSAANSEKKRASYRVWAVANPEKVRAAKRTDYLRNKLKYAEQGRAWAEANREKTRAAARRHYESNKSAYFARSAERRAAKLQRTPVWADLEKIELVYEEVRWLTVLMGIPYHVDHVVPLQGKKVSGLHVHNNLQILPGVENLRKSNNFEVP